jgi:hypothetical protein
MYVYIYVCMYVCMSPLFCVVLHCAVKGFAMSRSSVQGVLPCALNDSLFQKYFEREKARER